MDSSTGSGSAGSEDSELLEELEELEEELLEELELSSASPQPVASRDSIIADKRARDNGFFQFFLFMFCQNSLIINDVTYRL